MSLEMEPTLVTDPSLLDVLAVLMSREPIFHRPELGTTRVDFENMTMTDFWEVGASGRRYSRDYVLDTLEKRYASQDIDVWETRDFHCQRLAQDLYLLTYTLLVHNHSLAHSQDVCCGGSRLRRNRTALTCQKYANGEKPQNKYHRECSFEPLQASFDRMAVSFGMGIAHRYASPELYFCLQKRQNCDGYGWMNRDTGQCSSEEVRQERNSPSRITARQAMELLSKARASRSTAICSSTSRVRC
jgi:hypothetical protein